MFHFSKMNCSPLKGHSHRRDAAATCKGRPKTRFLCNGFRLGVECMRFNPVSFAQEGIRLQRAANAKR